MTELLKAFTAGLILSGIAVWLITITVAALDFVSSETREWFIWPLARRPE